MFQSGYSSHKYSQLKNKRKKKHTGVQLIKKANKLVESRYKFDIWETRVFLSVLAQIKRDDEDFKVYRVWYKDVINNFKLRSAQSYGLLRDAAKSLGNKKFYIYYQENGHDREQEYSFVTMTDVLVSKKKNSHSQEYVDIELHPKMQQFLLQLGKTYKGETGEPFTSYDLRNVVKLGAYHVRIYELLKQYQRIGSRELGIDDLKTMLEIRDEYPLFGNLFQKVIRPSVKAINKYTDLTITKLEKIKTGRKVTSLYFAFRPKTADELDQLRGKGKPQKTNNNVLSVPSEKDQLFDKHYDVVVKKFGVTPSVFLKTLEGRGEDDLEKAIRVTRRMRANNEIKKNVAGFFIKALSDGYTDTKEEARAARIEAEQKRFIKAKLQELDEELETNINQKIREILDVTPQLRQQAIDMIKANPLSNKAVLLKENELGRSLDIEDYREDIKLRHMVRANIVELAKDQFTQIEADYKAKMEKIKMTKYSPF